jgi:predicted dehydrogenase
MPEMTINWGIIGSGEVCEMKSGPAFYKTERSKLVAVMRRDGAKAADFARRHHVPAWYSSVEALLADPVVNAVYVATPPHLHKQFTIQSLEAGKPVYVEKPMAMNHAECAEMMQVAKRNGQKLFVAYYRRSMPYFLKIKEIIENRLIGDVAAVTVRQFSAPLADDFELDKQSWRIKGEIAGGGYFYDLAPHTLDLLDFLLGKIVDAKGFRTNIGKLYCVEDTVTANFHFECGAVGVGAWSFAAETQSSIDSVEIFGTKGKVQFSMFDFTPIQLTTQEGIQSFDIACPQHVQQPLIETVVADLLGKGLCPSPAESAIRTSWVIDKIFDKI